MQKTFHVNTVPNGTPASGSLEYSHNSMSSQRRLTNAPPRKSSSGETVPKLMEAPLETPGTTGSRRRTFASTTYTINPKQYWATAMAQSQRGSQSQAFSKRSKVNMKKNSTRRSLMKRKPLVNGSFIFPDEIWIQIFTFAMHVNNPEDDYIMSDELYQDYIEARINYTKCSVSLVCQKFNRISSPQFHAIPILLSSWHVRRFAHRIRSCPELATFVRALYLPDVGPFTSLCHLPVSLNQLMLNTTGFRVLPAMADSLTLVPLCQLMGGEFPMFPMLASTLTFQRFTNIRYLSLRGGESAFDPVAVREASLPCLEVLETHGLAAGLIDALLYTKLPSLKRLSMHRSPPDVALKMLKAHGRKLAYLQLNLLQCPEDAPAGFSVNEFCPHLIEPALYHTEMVDPAMLCHTRQSEVEDIPQWR